MNIDKFTNYRNTITMTKRQLWALKKGNVESLRIEGPEAGIHEIDNQLTLQIIANTATPIYDYFVLTFGI